MGKDEPKTKTILAWFGVGIVILGIAVQTGVTLNRIETATGDIKDLEGQVRLVQDSLHRIEKSMIQIKASMILLDERTKTFRDAK